VGCAEEDLGRKRLKLEQGILAGEPKIIFNGAKPPVQVIDYLVYHGHFLLDAFGLYLDVVGRIFDPLDALFELGEALFDNVETMFHGIKTFINRIKSLVYYLELLGDCHKILI